MSKISVCLASFNGEMYIQEQLSSILAQLSISDEIVISDDYSTDDTVAIARRFGDHRIKIFFNENTRGYSGNFENALNKSTGNIIFLADQDDVWLDDRVNIAVQELRWASLVVCNAQYVDKNLLSLKHTLFSLRGGKKGFCFNLYKLRYLGACMAFRRDIFPKLLPFPKQKLLCPHDMWIALICEFYYKVETISRPLILYRRHDNTVSNGGYKSDNGIFSMVLFRAYSFACVLTRFYK